MKRLDLDLLLGLTQDFKRFSLAELYLWYLLLMLVLSNRTDLPSATNITEQVPFRRLHKRIGGLMYIHFVLALEVVEISVLLLLILLGQGVIIHLHLHLHSTFLGPRLVMLP